MKLTENFNSEEFRASKKHPELLSEIIFTDEDISKFIYLTQIFLQPLRPLFGRVDILSGKRSPRLNGAVGGQPSSDHLYTPGTGSAAVDFSIPTARMKDVFDHIRDTRHGSYGQLIHYKVSKFIHLSLPTLKHLNDNFEWDK